MTAKQTENVPTEHDPASVANPRKRRSLSRLDDLESERGARILWRKNAKEEKSEEQAPDEGGSSTDIKTNNQSSIIRNKIETDRISESKIIYNISDLF